MCIEAIEIVRVRYRPKRIFTLFVGESPPSNGTFFYYGNSNMTRYMQRAVEEVFGESADFLENLKVRGWYLDDLVLTPVDRLTRLERKAVCLNAQASLASRIAAYRPLAIVSLLLSVRGIVDAAAIAAGSAAPRFAVPFSGNGQQVRFHKEMTRILPLLPVSPFFRTKSTC